MADLAIGLCLLVDRAHESFVWLAGRKVGVFCPFAAPPQQGVMDSFQSWLLLAWLRKSVLPLGSCPDHFSFVSLRLY